MDQLNHQDYYAMRAAASRAFAERAVDPGIAAIHAELATRYDDLVDRSARNGEAGVQAT